MKAIFSFGLLLTCVNLLAQGIFVPPRPGGTNTAAGTNVFAQANFNTNQFVVNGTVASIKNGALTTNLSLTTPAFSGLASGTITFAPGGIDLDTLDSILLRTDSSGFPAEANIGTGLSWDGSTLSATASGSQTPWLSDINGAATNRLTNVLSVSAGVYYLNQQRTAWISNDTMGNTHFVSSNYTSSGAAPMILNQFQGLLVIPQNILNTNEAADVRAYFNKTVVGTNTYTDAIGLPFMVFNNGREKLVVSNGVGNVHVDANLRVGTNIQAQSATFTGSGSPILTMGPTGFTNITADGSVGSITTGGYKLNVHQPAITVSNLLINADTNWHFVSGVTNLNLTNLVELSSGVASGLLVVEIENTNAVSTPLVLPAYGNAHGYRFMTNGLTDGWYSAVAPPGSNTVISFRFRGTNAYGFIKQYRRP